MKQTKLKNCLEPCGRDDTVHTCCWYCKNICEEYKDGIRFRNCALADKEVLNDKS